MKKKTSRPKIRRRSAQRTSPSPVSHPPSKRRPATRSTLDKVRNNILFTNVSSTSLARIAPKLVEHRYGRGDLIFDESTRARYFYLLVKGRIRIKKYTKSGIESLLAVLHPGDFFGELSIIDGLPRSARAEAMDPCTLFSIRAADVRTLIKESDAFTYNLLKNLALRLRTIDRTFVTELERNALSQKAKLDKLNMLIQASHVVNSTLDIHRLLDLILTTATRSTHADRGTVYLLDETRNELWSQIAQGKDMVEIRLPVGKGLAGYVAQTGDVVNIADAYRDPRFDPEIDRISGYTTRNVLCMAMRDKGGKTIGVVQLLNKAGGSFTQEDESFIDALSVHAAIAVENARLAREMVSSERLSAVGRMASTIIHDIKNPMAALHTYAQIIKKKTGDAESAEMAGEIIREVDRFVMMTQEVLDFSRGISALKMETASLNDVIDRALRSFRVELEKHNVTLTRNLEYAGQCRLDVGKMVRVIFNLARNAVDAMPDGGSLTITTRQHDGNVWIDFTDTGTGIPEDILPKVFEPFFTFGKKHGTGLGLPIVKKIIEDHSGTISVMSHPNRGTTIRIALPLT